ncbi:metallophosphoesterase [Natrarchaeobius oligotrophus]|uniref:Phosphoesterase n=1 Tax=Natrarchaeobius chitinivorans TaxID=1679083 RepID=A0A3N6MIL0_NATCH|nr:metallophosphoesterase [Natrarchaeobius chitinivorans]RQH01015.1 metallophosphoesterase [Natrarchaeobius chitinivorans]
MLAIFSDTHSTGGHQLEDDALAAAREADVVIHAGDFTSASALEAFQSECDRLFAVCGNADSAAVRDRLPSARVVETVCCHDLPAQPQDDRGFTATDGQQTGESERARIAVTHRRDGGQTGLSLFGRSRDADVVVSGHTHRPTVVDTDDCLLLNPGSHAQPRGNRPGFAVLEATDGALAGEVLEPDGTRIETFEVELG